MEKSLILCLILLVTPAFAQADLEIETRCVPQGRLGRLITQIHNRSKRPQSLKLPAGAVYECPSGPIFLAESIDVQVGPGQSRQLESLVIPMRGEVVAGICRASTDRKYSAPFRLTNQALRLVQGRPPLTLIMAVWPMLQLSGGGQPEEDRLMAQVAEALGNDPSKIAETQAFRSQIDKMVPGIVSTAPVPPVRHSPSDRVLAGIPMPSGAVLESPNRQYRFVIQVDGNCVISSREGQPLWGTATQLPGCRLLLGSRGRLMLVSASGESRWETGQDGPAGEYHLQMQDDGNLVIYRRIGRDQFTAHWASQREGRSFAVPR
ncbi:hypothetical protein IV102_18505 [bacterium]|nr:hypothetical protein [bacterium]